MMIDPPPEEISVRELLRQAREMRASASISVALDWFQGVILANPTIPQLYVELCRLLDAGNMTNEADDILISACQEPGQSLALMELLGRRIKARTSVVENKSPHPRRELGTMSPEFVNLIGSSYVRSFAKGTRFLPIMVGPGKSTSFLTDAAASLTTRITVPVVRRLDPRGLVLLVLSNADANNHMRDDFGTRKGVETGQFTSHEDVIERAVVRYGNMLSELLSYKSHKIAVLSALPMLDQDVNRMVRHLNMHLESFCNKANIPFVDISKEVADPNTGFLAPHLCSAEGNPHASHELLPIIERRLESMSLLPQESQDFEWTYMYRFSIVPEIETRIWSEPHIGAGNVLHSSKVTTTQIVERAVTIFLGRAFSSVGVASMGFLNCRDGYPALEIPAHICSTKIAWDKNLACILMAQRVARLFGRTDISFTELRCVDDVRNSNSIDLGFVVIHEDDNIAESVEYILALASVIRISVFVLCVQQNLSKLIDHKLQVVHSISLENRLISGYWKDAMLYEIGSIRS